MNNGYDKVGLYEHNIKTYELIRKAILDGKRIITNVQATGTGKSYIALQLALDLKDKKILFFAPKKAITEHVCNIINDNPNLDMRRDFPNLKFKTYSSLINLSREEIEALDVDILIADEIQHLDALVWGQRIKQIYETHPNLIIQGMTAYTTIRRGTSYERDVTDSYRDILFADSVINRYDLVDGMIDGVLPRQLIYRSSHLRLLDKINKAESIKNKDNDDNKLLKAAKRRILESDNIDIIFQRYIKPNGKFIYFCPPNYQVGVNDIDTLMKQAKEALIKFIPKENIIFYKTTSSMGKDGELNRDAFYNDLTLDGKNADEKLRIIFSINQYIEGPHAPGIDGVILGRETSSDIVFFESIGRALNVRGDTKKRTEELEKMSINELQSMCRDKEILFSDDTTKEELIQKLIAPIIIDLTDNYTYIKELENNFKNRVEAIRKKDPHNPRIVNIPEVSFDIEMINQDLFDTLQEVFTRLGRTWDEWYEYAKAYYEKHGDLEISREYSIMDENGEKISLGKWIKSQRDRCNPDSEQGQKLLEIGMRFERKFKKLKTWDEMYEYAKAYYEEHGDLEVPERYSIMDENGEKINLGLWIKRQRYRCNSDSEQGQKLLEIGMRFERKRKTWDEMYEYAKAYYEEHGDLEVPGRYSITDENGEKINLGLWIKCQRKRCNPDSEQGQKILEIGMHFERKRKTWDEWYEYAKAYYEEHGDLEVPVRYSITDENGEKINLGRWIQMQRQFCDLNSEQGQRLQKIGMIWNVKSNLNSVVDLCIKYNIDYNINNDIIQNISFQELYVKIIFLVNNNISIINSDGRLHEIFNMSNKDMMAKYNVSLETLIDMYYKKDGKKRSLTCS